MSKALIPVKQEIFFGIDVQMSKMLQTKEKLANRSFRFLINTVQY